MKLGMKKNYLTSLASSITLALALALPAHAGVTAQSYIVMAQDGSVLAEHNADDIRPLASITKLIALAGVKPGNHFISITPDEQDNIKGTRMRLKIGSYAQNDLFEAALISSNNEAAKAVGKSVPNLIDLVNKQNADLGLQLTLVEPSGLDPHNVGTARALAKFLWTIKDLPSAQISVTSSGKLPGRTTNRLLGAKGWEFQVVKTGYIKEAGGCVVTMTKIAGQWVVIAVLGSASVNSRWIDLALIRRTLAPDDMFYEPGNLVLKGKKKKK